MGTLTSDTLHTGGVLPGLEVGGAQQLILTLAKSPIERGHRIDLVMERFKRDAALPFEAVEL